MEVNYIPTCVSSEYGLYMDIPTTIILRIIICACIIDGLWPDYNDGTWPSCCTKSRFDPNEVQFPDHNVQTITLQTICIGFQLFMLGRTNFGQIKLNYLA